jgi:class 3 adenylate cyclase
MQRKAVTALFSDVTGSTGLGESIDPEALHAVLGRYFERMKKIVESHGGTVEKFIGDAVMAVFGVPAVGDVLIGEPTLALVRDAVQVELVEPLALKGKSEPVASYRLLSVREPAERQSTAPMVGRETELRQLRDVYEQAVYERSCWLFTVLGTAGVGKSRLVAEFVDVWGA